MVDKYLNFVKHNQINMDKITIGQLIEALPYISTSHARSNPAYKVLEKVAETVVNNSNLKKVDEAIINLGKLGNISFPFQEFGSINSLDLFGLDELIIFSFYLTNQNKYKKTYDIGANIGIHSIIMNLCGWDVTCIEPDPIHMNILKTNLIINKINNVATVEAAVSSEDGELEFVRVVGNTTSSHLAGVKQPYGDLVKFPVKVLSIKNIMSSADFIKMDVEGVEKEIILATNKSDWSGTDMMLEIGTESNALAIFEHLNNICVNSFSQKKGWSKVTSLEDVPSSYKEGSIFISAKEQMNW